MEVIIGGAVMTALWISSYTCFLPFFLLLKYNRYIRDCWFSMIFVRVLKFIYKDQATTTHKEAFELLHKSLQKRVVSKPLKVLEIGVGSGSNLEFYPENSHLTALDMNASFEPYLRSSLKKFPQIVYERTVISMAENMKNVEDCSVDLVVSTYVLCSVTDVQKVLKEVKRVLKPGGKFLFLEHVNFPPSDWRYTLQQFAAPLWIVYCNGCCLLRNIGQEIKDTGFSDVICEKVFPKSVLIFVRSQVYGLATK